MKINVRIINIRKHKNVAFIDGFTGEFGIIQFIADNLILERAKIKSGDLINITGETIINNSGKALIQIQEINSYTSCNNWESYKGINHQDIDVKYLNYVNARNGGSQLAIWKYKKVLVDEIRKILTADSFEDVTALINVVEKYRNGSLVVSPKISDRKDNKPKYLRVTLENQLKQLCSILLKSTFAIDKAFRNMGEDNGHLNEFLIFEFVSLHYGLEDIISFVEKMDSLARSLAQEFDFSEFIKELQIISYDDIVLKYGNFKESLPYLENVLVVNYPTFSPFIKEENGNQKEVRWYMRGNFVGHFYLDENDCDVIKSNLGLQQGMISKEDTNPMDYFQFGIPASSSFGMSVDRWLQLSLNKSNINSIANPLSLDYEKRNN